MLLLRQRSASAAAAVAALAALAAVMTRTSIAVAAAAAAVAAAPYVVVRCSGEVQASAARRSQTRATAAPDMRATHTLHQTATAAAVAVGMAHSDQSPPLRRHQAVQTQTYALVAAAAVVAATLHMGPDSLAVAVPRRACTTGATHSQRRAAAVTPWRGRRHLACPAARNTHARAAAAAVVVAVVVAGSVLVAGAGAGPYRNLGTAY